jgi:hypothetical protein
MSAGYGRGGIETQGHGRSSAGGGQPYAGQNGNPGISPGEAALEFLRDYSRERPEVVAMWAFGIGFLLAWKLKPW